MEYAGELLKKQVVSRCEGNLPVYIEEKTGKTWHGWWDVLDSIKDGCVITAYSENLPLNTYGETWKAYSYNPDQVFDTEYCSECMSDCMSCKYSNTEDGIDMNPECEKCKHESEYASIYNFCPNCGRPLTETAKRILAKRLRR